MTREERRAQVQRLVTVVKRARERALTEGGRGWTEAVAAANIVLRDAGAELVRLR